MTIILAVASFAVGSLVTFIIAYPLGYLHGLQDLTARMRGEPWRKRWLIP